MDDKWIKRFTNLAQFVADWSEDTSTRVGAVIVNEENDIQSQGWNGLPRGVKLTAERNERPYKYFFFEHAERNAIYNATRNGVCLKGSTIFVTHYPCADCARAIIQAGIECVYYVSKVEGEKWEEQNKASAEMFREANITVLVVDFLVWR